MQCVMAADLRRGLSAEGAARCTSGGGRCAVGAIAATEEGLEEGETLPCDLTLDAIAQGPGVDSLRVDLEFWVAKP